MAEMPALQLLLTLSLTIGKGLLEMTDTAEIIENKDILPILSRRQTAQKRRTEHEKAYGLVQNRCTFRLSKLVESSPPISPVSSVVERVIGNDEASGSIPLSGTTPRKTTERGALSEMEIMVHLTRLGANVWTPAFGHDHSFDLIAHWDGNLSRIQVKTMRDGDNGAIVMAGSSVVDRKGGKQWPVITEADCDVIVGWHPGDRQAYVVRPTGKTLYTFRRTPAKNNQLIGVWFEVDFRLTSLEQLLPRATQRLRTE